MVNDDRSLEQIIIDALDGVVVNEIKGVTCSISGTIEQGDVHVKIAGSGNKRLALILLTETLLSKMGQYTGSYENAVKAVTYYHNNFDKDVKSYGE